MNNEKKRFAILLLVPMCFVLAVVAIVSGLSFSAGSDFRFAIINKDELKKSNEQFSLNDNDISVVRDMVKAYYEGDKNQLRAGIREGSYSEDKKEWGDLEISFLMDVDEMKATYKVTIIHDNKDAYNNRIICASAKYSKYPDAYCRGTDLNSSISANMDDVLPYDGVDELGREFRLDYVNQLNQTQLKITLFSQCDDEGAPDAAMKVAKEFIRSHGMDPEQVPISIDKSACWYEDAEPENADPVLE